ncbi:hypothetical protein [Paenibacillus ottowii]|uniref:Uncharacterized protein n=1 Tax=Paenibacillus ottowii TaxID=2315729 RepID=A0ABY3B0W2_9BACL|nr:hypothetical protein [Paenibacillus ottowii]NEU27030.1 hypothetical protein [Paenibacillus polymyxa]TQR97322.1 hypothetical protein FKV70_19005 [Paenibacillus ottowii]
MFNPKVWHEDDKIMHTMDPLYELPFLHNTVYLDIGKILKLEHHGNTVYVKGEQENMIMVDVGYKSMKGLREYSHEIPTWMKEDFNRFLKE